VLRSALQRWPLGAPRGGIARLWHQHLCSAVLRERLCEHIARALEVTGLPPVPWSWSHGNRLSRPARRRLTPCGGCASSELSIALDDFRHRLLVPDFPGAAADHARQTRSQLVEGVDSNRGPLRSFAHRGVVPGLGWRWLPKVSNARRNWNFFPLRPHPACRATCLRIRWRRRTRKGSTCRRRRARSILEASAKDRDAGGESRQLLCLLDQAAGGRTTN